MAGLEFLLDLTGDFEITLGSDPSCNVVLPALDPKHSRLKREGDRLFLKPLRGANGTLLNRVRLAPGRWHEVTRYDEILVGGLILNLSAKFFLGRDRLGVESTRLEFRLASGRTICDGAYIRAEPGTLTAIIGLAGCGKTSFLNLLNGYLLPSRGAVRIGKEYDPRGHRHFLRDFVGYVPQDDILIPELTVRKSLEYRLLLKFPDMARDVRNRLIQDVCRQVGLSGEQAEKFLDTAIGGSSTRHRGLSGGERKRANIAQELISKPLVLFLDEPTSGLSSVDAEGIVELLHRLAREDALTIVATIHQPSQAAFELFDDLLVMIPGGKIVYYGPTKEAVEYFENVTDSQKGRNNPAEYVLSQAFSKTGMAESFREIGGGLSFVPKPLSLDSDTIPWFGGRKRPWPKDLAALPRQWFTLTRRNLRVLVEDRSNLLLLMIQAPLVAALLICAFYRVSEDTMQADLFARTIYFFDLEKGPLEAAGETLAVDEILSKASSRAGEASLPLGPAAVVRRGGIYFILTAAALWFGALGASREIVGEQSVIRRELRTCVAPVPYLASKVATQILVRGLQTAILAVLASTVLLSLTPLATLVLWIALWLVGVSASSLGLFVSSISSSSRVALTAVPLIMIPQLIFGGILRPEAEMTPEAHWSRAVAALTLQRWGFEAALAVDSLAQVGTLKQTVNNNWSGKYWEVNAVAFELSNTHDAFFPRSRRGSFRVAAVVLLATAGFFFLGGLLALRWRIP